MKFKVEISRRESVSKMFEVEANTANEAEQIALDKAYDTDFGRALAGYAINSCEPSMSLDFEDIIQNIREAMEELEGEQIVEIHNQICSRKIRYLEDSIWEYTGESDS